MFNTRGKLSRARASYLTINVALTAPVLSSAENTPLSAGIGHAEITEEGVMDAVKRAAEAEKNAAAKAAAKLAKATAEAAAKVEMEKAAKLAARESHGLEFVCVNPGVVHEAFLARCNDKVIHTTASQMRAKFEREQAVKKMLSPATASSASTSVGSSVSSLFVASASSPLTGMSASPTDADVVSPLSLTEQFTITITSPK